MSKEQVAELSRLKGYFPFRIIWGAISETGEFVSGANVTMHRANSFARKGWKVFTVVEQSEAI